MLRKIKKIQLACCVSLLLCMAGHAQQEKDTARIANIRYGENGFEMRTNDDKFLMHIQGRLQFRFATPSDQDPLTYDDYNTDNKTTLKINRARFKVGGHAYEKWLNYYFEYELSQSNLLDFRIMVEKWDFLKLKVGQWKVEFTRERFISSGEQQTVERSILNRPFTLDRQIGVELYGHLNAGGIADFNYWTAVLNGTGRGSTANDDNNLMYFGRGQWNFLGEAVPFEASDLEYHKKALGSVAAAVVTNRSPYTRFSQAGGGSLDGFEDGQPGQYRVKQLNLESAFVYRGFYGQAEWHHKQIIDELNADTTTKMRGYYIQGGYFFHHLFSWFPEKLEIAGRHSEYKPDVNLGDNLQQETSLDFNWFFNGHKNKLTTEFTYFAYQDSTIPYESGWRFRIQWDITF
jgi:phosphate-selective porin